MKRIRSTVRSRGVIAIIATIVTAVVVAGGLATALPGTRTVETNDLQPNRLFRMGILGRPALNDHQRMSPGVKFISIARR